MVVPPARVYEISLQGLPGLSPMANLPPRVPTELGVLDQAILLLGNRAKNSLTDKPRKRLIELIGVYPDAATAARWKAELKQIRKEMKEEGTDAEGEAG